MVACGSLTVDRNARLRLTFGRPYSVPSYRQLSTVYALSVMLG